MSRLVPISKVVACPMYNIPTRITVCYTCAHHSTENEESVLCNYQEAQS